MELPVILSGLLLTKKRTITLFYYILIPLTSPSYSILILYRTLFSKRIGIFIISACLDLIFFTSHLFWGEVNSQLGYERNQRVWQRKSWLGMEWALHTGIEVSVVLA